MRSTIESLIQLPLQIPLETSVPSKNERDTRNSINKSSHKKEAVEQIHATDEKAEPHETTAYSKGYIKYPRYDFF